MSLLINVLSNNGDIGPKKGETLTETFEKKSISIKEEYFLNVDVNPHSIAIKLDPKGKDGQLKEYKLNDVIILLKSLLDSIFIEQVNQIQIQYENFETIDYDELKDSNNYMTINKNIKGVGKKIKYIDDNFEIDVILEPNYVDNINHNKYSNYNLISRKHNFSSNKLEELITNGINTIITLESDLKRAF